MAEFRVDIPVEVTAHGTGLTRLEAELMRLYASAQRVGTAASAALSQMGSGAMGATAGMESAAAGAEAAAAGYTQAGAAASTAGAEASAAGAEASSAAEGMSQSAERAADSMGKVGAAGAQAGSQASAGLEQASGAADKFSARIEKTEQSIRKMVGQKIQLTLEAIDKVSPIVNRITSSVKSLTAKAWKVAVKMVDFVTAPFRALKNLITSPLMMTLGITGIGMGASSFVSTFKEFTAGMSNVKALSGATEAEFVKLTETAENLGATTKFTAAEASEGMQYLAMAGWKTNEIISAMPGLLDLAAAGGTSLGTAADIVSDVMTAMGMSANEASRAADIFARTATGTNTTIENLGESLKYAAPAAHTFGLSLSEVATVTGMMANAGVKGSMAGTALRASLLEMASPSKKATEAMTALGLTFADSAGNMKDMKTIIGDLSKAFGGLSQQEKLTYAEDIFGTRGSSAWLSVIEQGTDAYNRLFESIDKSNGAAKEMAETQLDNLAGDITLLQSAVDGMKISVMKQLDPYLRRGVQWITNKIPEVTEMLSGVASKAIEKFGQVKDFLVGVFNSPDFKNADGFADKLFVAWDKIIAEPFSQWWEGGGKDKILNLVSSLGKNIGEVYHGVISGIFAAIKGEEIDFEGMNLTGLAKAGAEAAKSFVGSFVSAFDLSGLIGQMPSLMKVALAGFGAVKIGGGILGVARVVRDLKLAFGTVAPAATQAGAAIEGVGVKAASTVGKGILTKLGTGIKSVGTALASIPTWGWIAAAALAAVAIGISAYTKAQEAHRQEILHLGDDALVSAKKYQDSVRDVQNAADTIEQIKELEIKIKSNKGHNEAVVEEVRQQIETLQGKKIAIEVEYARGNISEDEYLKQIDELNGKKIEIIIALKKEGYNEAAIQAIIDQYNGVEAGQKEITLIIAAKTDITPEQIADYVQQLSQLMEKKTQLEIMIEAKGLKPDEVSQLKKDLDQIKSKKAELEIQINKGQGSMSDADWKALVDDYNSLTQQAGTIELQIAGATADDKQIQDLKKELGEIRGEANAILLNIGYSDNSELKQADIDKLANLSAELGVKELKLKISLEDGSLTPEDIQNTQKALDAMYERLAEMSGGAFTAEELSSGAASVEQVQAFLQKKADYDLLDLQYKVEDARAKAAEGAAKREEYRQSAEEYAAAEQAAGKTVSELKNLEQERKTLNKERDIQKARADRGEMTTSDYQSWYWGEYAQGIHGLQDKYREITGEDFAPTDAALMSTEGGFDLTPYEKEAAAHKANKEAAQADYDQQTATLKNLYEAEKTLKQGELFNGTDYAGYSVEELADNFTHLDEAGRQAFETALQGLDEVNKAADYLSDAEKTNIGDILGSISDKANAEAVSDAVGTVRGKLEELWGTYDGIKDAEMKAEEGKAHLEEVNSALSALNLDKIDDFSQLGDILSGWENIDFSNLDFSSAASSATALGESTDAAKAKLESVQTALTALAKTYNVDIKDNAASVEAAARSAKGAADALAGSYTVHFNITTSGSMPSIPSGGNITKSAQGGIFDGAFLSWVAEDGPEAIIPLGADKRNRGLDLWLQAGRALGVSEFADGGLMAPYTGLFEALPEDGEYTLPSTGNSSIGGNVIQVNAEVNPVFQIEGTDGEDIMDKLRSKQRELAELFGGAIADQLEDIVSNMV